MSLLLIRRKSFINVAAISRFFFAFTFLLQFIFVLFYIKTNLYQNRTQVYVGDTQLFSGKTRIKFGERNYFHPKIAKPCKRALLK